MFLRMFTRCLNGSHVELPDSSGEAMLKLGGRFRAALLFFVVVAQDGIVTLIDAHVKAHRKKLHWSRVQK